MVKGSAYIRWFENISSNDVLVVGGKNASLGEMIRTLKDEGIRVPDGFAITAEAFWKFLEANDLMEKIKFHLENLKSGARLWIKWENPYVISFCVAVFRKRLLRRYGNPTRNYASVTLVMRWMWQ